jgi:hypothetical protein
MSSNAISLAGALLAIVTLAIGTVLARRRRADAPPTAIVRQ